MNVGATAQEVLESKQHDLEELLNQRPARSETNKTIYYYQRDDQMPYNSSSNNLYVPIENYSASLIKQLDTYLNKINRSLDVDSVEVLVTLRSVIFPNDKEFQLIQPSSSIAVWEMVQRYTKCIMQIVGKLAECVLVDQCANDSKINQICMNIALFKREILEEYNIQYDEYVAYSTSFAYMVYPDSKSGISVMRKNQYYNPNHTSQDIGWCKKENIWDQLRTEMEELHYIDNAKLQVKTTIYSDKLDLDDYLLTPIIVFDFDHGYNLLKKKYPHHIIYSGYDLFPEMAIQMEKYFQIIAAYVCGLTNKLNLTETDLKNDKRLQTLFRTSVREITNRKREFDKTGLIKLARDAGKPMSLMV